MLAQDVYGAFLDHVVKDGAFSDDERRRAAGSLTDADRVAVTSGKKIERRTPYLTKLSGKGGWTPDQTEFDKRRGFTNVSLLEHLASVTRGALVFAEIDLRAAGVPERDLPSRLARIAAVAFLHDADKMLGRSRVEEITSTDMEDLMARYHIPPFLEEFGQSMTSDEAVALVNEVEITRAGYMRPGAALVHRDASRDSAYVRLADRLDGTFLGGKEAKSGLDALTDHILRFDALRTDALKHGWKTLRISSPHTPFLLDELQAALSYECRAQHGFPPLIELHHDGELLVMMPETEFELLFDKALGRMGRLFRGGVRVQVSTRNMPDIIDARGGAKDVRRYLQANTSVAEKCLVMSASLVADDAQGAKTKDAIGATFCEPGRAPVWRMSGQSAFAWSFGRGGECVDLEFGLDAAVIGAVLACKDPDAGPLKAVIPNASAREIELRDVLAQHSATLPHWLNDQLDNVSRTSLLAAYTALVAEQNSDLHRALLGESGLVDVWLEGDGQGRRGLLEKNVDVGAEYGGAVRDWFSAMARREFVGGLDEASEGRCHFTNTPLSRTAAIDTKTGLYGLKVSAFSGREGRPEAFDSTMSETLVSPIMKAEHRLRAILTKRAGESELSLLVSSPTSMGLFATLVFDADADATEYGFYDILRADPSKGLTFSDVDNLNRRLRIGRYEASPRGTKDLIAFLRRVIECARRTGRPIHIWRGMPKPEKGFVTCDFLPDALRRGLNGSSFRIEQLDWVHSFLSFVEGISETTGFGLDLAMRVADPDTRFAAACDVMARFDRQSAPPMRIRRDMIDQLIKESTPMDHDSAIVRFAEAMARVQRGPIPSDGANRKELGLRTAIEAVEGAQRMKQVSRDSLMASVAGAISVALNRGGLYSRAETRAGQSIPEAVEEAATLFVDSVWPVAFGGSSPAARMRRTAYAIYSVSFERAARAFRHPIETLEAPEGGV